MFQNREFVLLVFVCVVHASGFKFSSGTAANNTGCEPFGFTECWQGPSSCKCRFPEDTPPPACCPFTCKGGEDCRAWLPPTDEGTWKSTYTSIFGPEGLVRQGGRASWDGKGPGDRAISFGNLLRVRDFIVALADAEGKVTIKKRGMETEKIKYSELTMNDVNGLLVLPLTAPVELSFVEHLQEQSSPTYMISHSWGGRFLNFVTTVTAHYNARVGRSQKTLQDEVFYWVCTFANNQWRVADELGSAPDDGPFATAIANAMTFHSGGQEVLAVQDDLVTNSYTMGRAWCAYEIDYAMKHSARITFGCSNGALITNQNYDFMSREKQYCSCHFVKSMAYWTWKDSQAFGKEKIEESMRAGRPMCGGDLANDNVACLEDRIHAMFTNVHCDHRKVLENTFLKHTERKNLGGRNEQDAIEHGQKADYSHVGPRYLDHGYGKHGSQGYTQQRPGGPLRSIG